MSMVSENVSALPVAFLARLADSLQEAERLEDLVRPMLSLLQAVTGLESTYLTRIDEQAGVQRILFANNTQSLRIPEGLQVDWNDTLCKRALDEGCNYTDDVAGRWGASDAARELGIATYASVPVPGQGEHVYGTLCAASREQKPLATGADQVMRMFSQLIGQQIERERLFHELQHAYDALAASATTDALTGLPNRRALIAELERRLRHRDGRRLLVAFVDLDGFKAINDQHGHKAGDRFLVAIGAALRHAGREEDVCARLGGDEFVMLASVSTEQSASAISTLQSRLTHITCRRFDLGEGLEVDYPGASVGVIQVPDEEQVADAVLSMADAAMYAVKRARKASRPIASPA